jgi:hypothetical protein
MRFLSKEIDSNFLTSRTPFLVCRQRGDLIFWLYVIHNGIVFEEVLLVNSPQPWI